MTVKGKDTSDLMNELRLLVGKRDLAVYDIHVRLAGYGISYAKTTGPTASKKGFVTEVKATVYQYYPTLQQAVVGEMKAWSSKFSARNGGPSGRT
jgi:hypothetical protein